MMYWQIKQQKMTAENNYSNTGRDTPRKQVVRGKNSPAMGLDDDI